MSPRVRPSLISEMTVGSGVVMSRVSQKGRISRRDIRARETVRSRVFVVSFY